MAFHAGHGGSVSFASVTLHNEEWSINVEGVNANVTNSGSNGWRQRHPCIKDWNGSVTCPWDDTNIPLTDLAAINSTGTFIGNLGASGKFFSGPIIVTNVSYTNNNDDDVVRVTIDFEGSGALTMPLT